MGSRRRGGAGGAGQECADRVKIMYKWRSLIERAERERERETVRERSIIRWAESSGVRAKKKSPLKTAATSMLIRGRGIISVRFPPAAQQTFWVVTKRDGPDCSRGPTRHMEPVFFTKRSGWNGFTVLTHLCGPFIKTWGWNEQNYLTTIFFSILTLLR